MSEGTSGSGDGSRLGSVGVARLDFQLRYCAAQNSCNFPPSSTSHRRFSRQSCGQMCETSDSDTGIAGRSKWASVPRARSMIAARRASSRSRAAPCVRLDEDSRARTNKASMSSWRICPADRPFSVSLIQRLISPRMASARAAASQHAPRTQTALRKLTRVGRHADR